MGLDAVVYRSRKSLPFDPVEAGASLDTRTGEHYFQEIGAERQFGGDAVIALERRLGNVDLVRFLFDAVGRLLGRSDTLLQTKVLFDGTHAGDVIESIQFPRLAAELAELREASNIDQFPELTEFIRSIEDLIDAATQEGNPIVFT